MSLHFRFLLPVCVALCSNYALAMEHWWQTLLSEQSFHLVKSEIQNRGSWYRCESELSKSVYSAVTMCLDDFNYYHQRMYGEATLENDRAEFIFLNQYQWQNWNDLILNLRKDGFVMRSVHFDDAEYDVVSSLKQKSSEQVDKEVILMMNRYPPEAKRAIQWVRASEFGLASPKLEVKLKSDGDMIEMHVIRF